ncbi:MAG: M48 family metallopeptidase [Phycisphaerales bacterium]
MLATFCVGAILGGCHTVPGTGRSQFNVMSTDAEMKLGRDAYATELKDAKIITSGPQYEMVKRVCTRVSAAADKLYPDATKGFAWEFKLVDDPSVVNAWCLPGGKIAIFTGLLQVAKTEGELAAVVGHECAHAIARHGGERMTQQNTVAIILQGVSAGMSFGELSPATQEATMSALGAGAEYGVLLPFSRSHESEADEIGLYIAAAAGYDPREAIQLWKNMASLGGEKPPEWMSTHPADETRIARLQKLMPKAMKIWEENGGKP